MDVNALSSVNGLAATARSAQLAPVAAANAGPSFSEMLGQVVAAGVNTIQAGETAALQGLTGAAPPFKVVEAVMAAQRALQEGLSLRDKAVSAYQEIARMAI